MALFRYIGEYPDGQSELVCFGRVFAPGLAVELPEGLARKAMGNRFFEAVEAAEPASESASPHAVEIDPAKEFTKDELIEQADKLGVEIDKRWGAKKIAAAIIAAAGQLPADTKD